MFRQSIAIILCASLLPAGAALAGEARTEVIPLQATLQKEPVQFTVPVYRAYASAGNDRFAFLVPKGFWLQGDPALGKLTLVNTEGNSTITFAIADPRPVETITADFYRELVLKENPTGKIVQELTSGAAGRSGPAFDVQWKAGGDLVQIRRVIFIPTSAGVLEFTATTTHANFPTLQTGLDLILTTFLYSTNGKLEVPHLTGKV